MIRMVWLELLSTSAHSLEVWLDILAYLSVLWKYFGHTNSLAEKKQ